MACFWIKQLLQFLSEKFNQGLRVTLFWQNYKPLPFSLTSTPQGGSSMALFSLLSK